MAIAGGFRQTVVADLFLVSHIGQSAGHTQNAMYDTSGPMPALHSVMQQRFGFTGQYAMFFNAIDIQLGV